MHRRHALGLLAALPAVAATTLAARTARADSQPSFTFPSIDGGVIDTALWRGRPVLVVNTASLCGFTPQLEQMQALHDRWGPKGLVVLAVPSDDFRQELDDAAAVKEFCTLTYGLTLPMTDIVHVARGEVHPFFRWLRDAHGFVPRWNFNKVLLGPAGEVVATWGSPTRPDAAPVVNAFRPLLPRA